MILLKLYILGAILVFILSFFICKKEEKFGKEVEYGVISVIALASWIGLAILIYSYKDTIKTFITKYNAWNTI